MSTTDTERCEREGLTPDGEGLIVDCTIHGQIGRVQAGHHEAERGDALIARHRADTEAERDERLRQLAALLLRHGHAEWDEFDARTVASVVMEDWADPILAEVARLDAVVTAVRGLREEYFDEDGHTEPEDVWRLHRDLGRALDGGAA